MEMANTKHEINKLTQHTSQIENIYGRGNQLKINCIQINLQHSRVATHNLMQLIGEQKIDIAFVQEPYVIENKVAAIPSHIGVFTQGRLKKRAAVLVTNRQMDAILISQLSDEDMVVVQIKIKNMHYVVISAYFDGTEDINPQLQKISKVIEFARNKSLLIATDSNARSVMWHDVITNGRGRSLEDFTAANELYILNDKSISYTFETVRGKSNIDLTIANHLMLDQVKEWQIAQTESCSDHRLITFNISAISQQAENGEYNRNRYKIRPADWKIFDQKITSEFSNLFAAGLDITDDTKLDILAMKKLKCEPNFNKLMEGYNKSVQKVCTQSFITVKRKWKKNNNHKSVPWWSQELTEMRKKVNSLRRLYQRTQNNEKLREERKQIYYEGKARYTNKIKQEKISSWKQYCTISEGLNP